jgi:catechol 2,3-dioxygenase-like lactoylglutathione lyase family enzyme
MSRFARVVPRLPVADLQGSVDWYVDVLGFTCGNMWPEEDPTFAIIERDGVAVQLYVTDTLVDTDIGNAMLSFDVSDATALHKDVEAKAAIDWGPEVYWYGRREFAVTDPNGYMIILSEETSDPVTAVETDPETEAT